MSEPKKSIPIMVIIKTSVKFQANSCKVISK